MIIFDKVEEQKTKNIEELLKGDILQRKEDKCYYELKDISIITKPEYSYALYHFYGFSIKGKYNMRFHFSNEYGNFKTYKEII